MMAVVKADGYGHGMAESARAARDAGAEWLGVATIDEALALRAAGDTGRVLCWLTVPGEDFAAAIEADVDVTVYSEAELGESRRARPGTARRGSSSRSTPASAAAAPRRGAWPALFAAAARAGARRPDHGHRRLVALLVAPTSPTTRRTTPRRPPSSEALDEAERAGLRPEVRHLANSAAAILRPSSRFDLVRVGIAAYGLDPAPGPHARPRAGPGDDRPRVAWRWSSTSRRAPPSPTAGPGPPSARRRSAWCRWVRRRHPARRPATAPRSGSTARAGRCGAGSAWTSSSSTSATTDAGQAGADAVLFGPGVHGEPTAQDWAEACGTISYEIVTRIGGRMVRRHVDSDRRSRPMSRAGRIVGVAAGRGRRRRRRRRGRRRPPAPGRSDAAGSTTPRSAACGPRRSPSSPTTGSPLHVEVDELEQPPVATAAGRAAAARPEARR